jgi:putative chitinase
MKLTDEQLKHWFPHCPKTVREEILPVINKTCLAYNTTNQFRLAAFLATLAVESGEFRYQEEIASGSAYEGRQDLGNTQKGDGKRFKGRGRIQITGRKNYQLYTEYLRKQKHLPFVDFTLNPQQLAKEPYATDSACWFFAVLIDGNQLADKRQFLEIQLRVNGGRKRSPPRPNHWKERKAYYEKGLQILPNDFFLD